MKTLLRSGGASLGVMLLVSSGGCAGGSALRVSDVTPEAIPSLQSQLARRPQDPAARARLGVAYFRAQRYDSARILLDTAVVLDPQSGLAAIYLGMTAEAQGDFPAARQAYERYVAVSRSRELRDMARQRLRLVGRRALEYNARQALAREAEFTTQAPEANTIAVMPFSYGGSDEDFRALTRGFAQLIVTDLARSRLLRVLERERMQAMIDEMRLSDSGLVEQQSAVRSGRLLRAARVVQGSLADVGRELRVDAAVVDVTSSGVAAAANAQDLLDRLFDIEKTLVFRLFADLGIQLSPAEREAIEQRPTQNLQAFLAYSRGLEAEDRGDYTAAQRFFNEAASIDPAFIAAVQGASAAAELQAAATTTVGDVEQTVVRNEQQEVSQPATTTSTTNLTGSSLTNSVEQTVPTQVPQDPTPQTPPAPQRDPVPEGTGTETPRPPTGTIRIVIRRP